MRHGPGILRIGEAFWDLGQGRKASIGCYGGTGIAYMHIYRGLCSRWWIVWIVWTEEITLFHGYI